MKIPFDIKYRPQIESGEYKVETRDGRPIKIIFWEARCIRPIVAMIPPVVEKHIDILIQFSENGKFYSNGDSGFDLFIITPEEELTEFEIRLLDWLSDDTSGEIPMERMKEVVRNKAAELLSLAREQFIKDGYVIEKKTFHDAAKRVDSEVKKEVSDYVELSNLIDDLNKRYPEVSFAKLTRIAKAAYDKGVEVLSNDIAEVLHSEYEKGGYDVLKTLEEMLAWYN